MRVKCVVHNQHACLDALRWLEALQQACEGAAATDMPMRTPATTTSGATEAMRCSPSALLRSACTKRAWPMAFCRAFVRASATALLTDSTPVTALQRAAKLSAMVPVPEYRSSRCCSLSLDSPACVQKTMETVRTAS